MQPANAELMTSARALYLRPIKVATVVPSFIVSILLGALSGRLLFANRGGRLLDRLGV